jgi:hypothetical protein
MENYKKKLEKCEADLSAPNVVNLTPAVHRQLQRQAWLMTGKLAGKHCWHGLSKIIKIYERLDMVPVGFHQAPLWQCCEKPTFEVELARMFGQQT